MTPPRPAAAAAFSAHAADYDALRRRLVPGYDAFYGAVADVLASLPGGVRRVLDLGAGTGLLGAQLAARLPGLELELLDASPEMLARARERLGDAVTAIHVADMGAPLPAGPFDAVVSALAIHHLQHDDQRRLFARVRPRLRPGGAFVNAEQVDAPWPEMTRLYEEMWARECRALGACEADLDGARERMRHDRCADVPSLLAWLHDGGFARTDVVYKSWRLAVLVAFTEGTAQ